MYCCSYFYFYFHYNFTHHYHYHNNILISLSPAATLATRSSLLRVLPHKAQCTDDFIVDSVLVVA